MPLSALPELSCREVTVRELTGAMLVSVTGFELAGRKDSMLLLVSGEEK